jgi:hypothetical protein
MRTGKDRTPGLYQEGGYAMKRSVTHVVAVVVTFFTCLFSVPATGDAEVHLNIGFNFPLPVYTIPAPPSVVVIPGTHVYYVPDVPEEIFFYQGYWYRPYRKHWYRAAFYDGPWVTISPSRVPYTLVNVHPGYRGMDSSYRPIPYVQLKKKWRHYLFVSYFLPLQVSSGFIA